jgi:hypothetical protein
MTENQPLEVFLTHIKRAMHHYMLTKKAAQTPELRIFPCPKFTVVGYVSLKHSGADSIQLLNFFFVF